LLVKNQARRHQAGADAVDILHESKAGRHKRNRPLGGRATGQGKGPAGCRKMQMST
jgi:hypothetical protein